MAAVFPEKVLLYSIDCVCTDGPAALIFRMKLASMEHWSPERCPLRGGGRAVVTLILSYCQYKSNWRINISKAGGCRVGRGRGSD